MFQTSVISLNQPFNVSTISNILFGQVLSNLNNESIHLVWYGFKLEQNKPQFFKYFLKYNSMFKHAHYSN
jgi:hypothetical protein